MDEKIEEAEHTSNVDDTEQEIESQASHSLKGEDDNDATQHLLAEVARRSSLDRSYTMPAPSWEEGDQILKEYRLRKAAREAARRTNRSSDGGVWSITPRSQASGSAPPLSLSVLHESDTARSPSRNTLSSTVSFRRHMHNVDDDLSPVLNEADAAAFDAPLPSSSSASGSMTSSRSYKLPTKLSKPSSLRRSSTHASNGSHQGPANDTNPVLTRQSSTASNTRQRRRPSSIRATSDGPVTSRRSSSRLGNVIQVTTTINLSRNNTSSTRGRAVSASQAPAVLVSQQEGQDQASSSTPSSPASMIDHGEGATATETDTETDAQSAASLASELRGHKYPIYEDDDDTFGMPKEVTVDGQVVDISGMDIVDRIDMMRRAQVEAKAKVREPLDFYQTMPSTDLSVIAERTECSTVSRRTTIAPTEASETPRSYLNPSFGRQLAPTHARSHLSLSTTRSGTSAASSTSGNGMTQAEKIKSRYLRQSASEGDDLKQANAPTSPRSGRSTPGSGIPGHRKYTSIGETNYHTLPLSPTSSIRGDLRISPSATASSSSMPTLPPFPRPAFLSSRMVGSGSGGAPALQSITVPSRNTRDLIDPLKTASSGDGPYIPSNVSSSAASRPSLSKHVFSPTISQKIEAYQRAPLRKDDNDYLTSPLSFPTTTMTTTLNRQRSKSLHSDDRSSRGSRPKTFGVEARSPPVPTALGLPPSKSTSALVQLFESRAAAGPSAAVELRSSSPVKEWLKKIDPSKAPASPGIYPPTPATISSASGSMVDYNAHKRRREREDNASSARLSASTAGRQQQRRRRSQSLTALPEVLVTEEVAPSAPASSATTTSFEDAVVVFHGDLYWLDSSSAVRPPFWQACRAVITTSEELRISWLGAKSGGVHERFYDLRSCTAAHSIRRPPHITATAVQAYEPGSPPPTQNELSRLQVFELVWPGRTHRFACPSLATRIKWLGHIFEIIVRYSNTNTPQTEQEPMPAEERSIGSATLRSLELPRPTLTRLSSEAASDVSSMVSIPKRQLERETQDSLYASVNDMLSGASSSRKAGDLPDIPRYQLKDLPSPSVDGSRTPLSPVSVAPGAPRGAWSDIERGSTKSDPIHAGFPAAKTVARDLKRILTMMNKTRTASGSSTIGNGFPDQMKEMQSHLERISQDIRHTSVASRHSRHAPEMVSKMDELLALCKRMAEEKPKVLLYAQEKLDAIPEVMEPDSSNKDGPEQKNAGLVRLEEKVETLLEVVNRLAAMESPVAQKQSKSPQPSPEQAQATTNAPPASVPTQASAPTQASVTTQSASSQAPLAAINAAHLASSRAFNMLPSTPSLMSDSELDFDQDLQQWQQFDKKRNRSLPPLPPLPPLGAPIALKEANRGQVANMQAMKEQAALADFYNTLGQRPEPSSRPSSIVSSNRVRNARSDAAMRLEGSHPAVVATQPQSVQVMNKRGLMSKWSADTPLPDPNSRRPSVKLQPAQASPSRPTKTPRKAVPIPVAQSDDDEDSSPPTPKQRDFPNARVSDSEPAPALAPAPIVVTDTKAQEAIISRLKSMEGLLQTLVKAQAKQGEALKHQEDVSIYIKHLQEYLAEDRDSRKEEFATIKASLAGMSQQISSVPKEVQTLIEASLAVSVLQRPHIADVASVRTATPAPAPDTDAPGGDDGASGDAPVPTTTAVPAAATAISAVAAATQQGVAPQSKGKKSGTSLLRKVSLGIAGLANVGTSGQGGVKVGGPRKMGARRLFANAPAGATAPDAKDRWNTDRYKTGAAPATIAPLVDTPEQDAPEAQATGVETPLMAALAGIEKNLHEDSGDNDEQTAVIALGILEVLRMLREKENREHEREHYRREDEMLRIQMEEERHADQLESVRAELREWEAKSAELAAANIKDEVTDNIESIIALLKDQMAHQELALVNLKDTLTPQIRDIGAESEEAILAMREEMTKSLSDFRTQLDEEVKKTLDEVGALRDQKKQLQSDLSDLLAFKSKYGGGAPEAAQQQQRPASQHPQHRMPIQPIRPTARQAYAQAYPQAHSQAYPPPRPDTSMSAAAPQYHWGLKGPR